MVTIISCLTLVFIMFAILGWIDEKIDESYMREAKENNRRAELKN